jgi:HK97 family phage portal protein
MLAGIFRGQPEQRSGALTDIDWWGDAGSSTFAGVRVTTESALQLLTVLGCVQFIAGQISMLPVDVYRKVDGASVEQTPPPWLRRPTPTLSFQDWVGQMLSSLMLAGNAYAWVQRSPTAGVVSLTPLDPATVSVDRVQGRKVFRLNGDMRPDAEILHIPGIMLAGKDVGLSPIEYARQSIGLGISALEFGSKFFDGEGNMPGVIETPGPMQPDQIKNLASQWRAKRTRAGRGLPGILTDGGQWKMTGVTNEQAQFLATRQFTAAEIAGQMFLVDPSELGIPVNGTSLTYANLEERKIRRKEVTLQPWVTRLEASLTALLPQPRYVRFNFGAYLRGDLMSQYSAGAMGIQNDFLTPNEVRTWFEYPPLPGGDQVVAKATPAPSSPPEADDDVA